MRYANLHNHSNYSNMGMLDAFGTVKQIVTQCKKIGNTAAVLTDHGTTGGHIKLIRECKDQGIKPVCGCEMYVVDDLEVLKRVRDKLILRDSETVLTDENQEYSEDERSKARMKNHFCVLAANQQGLVDLWDLVSHSWIEGFYFKPTIDWAHLAEKKDNLFFGTACEVGPLGRALDQFYHILHQQIKQECVELSVPYDTMVEQIAELKKEIKEFRLELKELEKAKKLTDAELKEITGKIKECKTKIYEIELEYRELETIVHEKHKDNIELIRQKIYEDSKVVLREKLQFLKDTFGDRLYVEIIPVPEERARWKYVLSYQVAKELGVRLVATNDSHYPTKSDSVYQDILYTTNLYRSDKEVRFDDVDRNRYSPELFYIHGADEMFERMKSCFPEISDQDIEEMINNSSEIIDQIETVVEPSVPAVAFEDINSIPGEKPINLYTKIQKLLQEGWQFRELSKLTPEKRVIYQARVKRELEVILYKGYIDYFMLMSDIMDWCDKGRPFIENFDKWWELNKDHFTDKEATRQMLQDKGLFDFHEPIGTGIARGSAGGSLVAYLLRITNIDPMPGELLFERFIDYTRGDVYYSMDYNTYSKKQFKKEFPEEDKNNLDILVEKYETVVKNKVSEFLSENKWYDKLQILREFWLLDHNQQFSREKEYFYTTLDKHIKGEITVCHQNKANSILSWVMGITDQEPKGDYIVNLTDIPDIDSDFEDHRRHEVYKYLTHRYGIQNTCRISTYTILKAPSTIDLLSKIFDNETRDIMEIKTFFDDYCAEHELVELSPKEIDDCLAQPQMKQYWEKYDWLKHVKPLMGQIIANGMHAAGIIVHNQKISNFGAVYINKDKETGENSTVICWDSIEAESMGLMKLDLLALNTVTNIKRINEIVTRRHGWEHHWQRIPNVFEDEKTKALMKRADMVGLFQLEGNIMTNLAKHLKPDNFEEIVFIAAGGRPGPLQDALEYAEIKHGTKEPYYYNSEIYKSITERWGGKIIYQEDLMKLSKLMCGYDDAHVGKIRKIVSKVQRDKMKQLEPEFIGKLMSHSGMSKEEATKLWLSVVNFGAYAFNKCLSEDTKITKLQGSDIEQVTLSEVFKQHKNGEKLQLSTLNQITNEFESDIVKDVMYSGQKQCYQIELEDGTVVESSKDHKFLTDKGWKKLEEITEDDSLYTSNDSSLLSL